MNYGPKVKAYCAKNNIEIGDETGLWDGNTYRIYVTTPFGRILRGMGDHTAVTDIPMGYGITKNDAWESVWEDLAMGIEDCDIPGCDMCASMKYDEDQEK